MPLVIQDFTDRELERFWNKVSKSDSCWNWIACKYPGGYGAINLRGRCNGAHRMSWSIHYGEIPDGCEVCHHCDNPSCVNPAHLYAASHSQNVKDMHIKGRGVYSYGDSHWTRKHPERVLRGDLNGARKHPERMSRGEKNGNSKLTDEDVIAIRCLHGEGFSSPAIGRQFHLDRSTVMDVVNLKTWRHLI